VPYFFSDISDWVSLEYVGPAPEWDQEVVRGSIDDGEFSIFYLQSGRVAAALSIGRSDDLEAARRLIKSHADVSERIDQLGDLSTDLEEF
jgi:3-phenylpropionate/trans-cinnamate dioxygenase ferredoxin reductase component